MQWLVAGVAFALLILLGAYVLSLALRKFLRRGSSSHPTEELAPQPPRSEDQAAFLTASMQAVIQRLREQERELERLHRVEKERAQQTERLSEAVTRNMPTGLLLASATGLITMANPAAETALGVGALHYRRYTDILGADSPLARLLTRCLREARTFQREEVEHTNRVGEKRQLGATISPILQRQAQGQEKVAGALVLLSDLTELTALQKQIRLTENLAALGEMSAGIAHEFKNALAIISGYAQMIRGEAGTGELADCAQRILDQTRALTHVVTEFLRFARPLEVAKEVVNLGPVVERVVAELREALPHVAVTAEGEFAEVSGDEGLLRQALLNLARNAAEAAAEKGAAGRVVLRGAREENAGRALQRISVFDNGPGIPPEDLPRIFVPFYTTKADGTGLGLAVVQKILLQHGGRIEARNLPEGGAEFIVWLPARSEVAAGAIASPSSGI